METVEHQAHVLDLLTKAYDRPSELAHFLRRCRAAAGILDDLPSDPDKVGKNDYFGLAVPKLFSRNLVRDQDFWRDLLNDRRGWADEIIDLAWSFKVALIDDQAGRPILHPTLREWTLEHRRALEWFVIVPTLVGLGIYLLYPVPGSRVIIALHAGQATFVALVALCFAAWREPQCMGLFGTDPAYLNLWRHIRSKDGLKDERWRSALGIGPDDDTHIEPWYEAAQHARTQMRWSWISLYLAWMLLYLALIAAPLFAGHAMMPLEMMRQSIVVRFLNDVTSVALFTSFWILTFKTVKFSDISPDDDRPRSVDAQAVGFIVALLIMFIHAFCVLTAPDDAMRADFSFRIFGGFMAAVATAMFVGRLDSPILGIRWWLLAPLYVYAAIQPCFPFNQLALEWIFPRNEEEMKTGLQILQYMLYMYALVAKFLLFVVFAWLYHTGRLDFYLLRVRRLNSRLAKDWRRLTRSGTTIPPVVSRE